MSILYQLVDWDRVHENHDSRKLKRLYWVSIPADHGTCGYRTLMAHPNGTAIYGAFHQILTLAAQCDPRGTLIRGNGKPHTAASIAISVGGDAALIQECLDLLQDPEIGWIEAVELPAESVAPPVVSGESPVVSGESPDGAGGFPDTSGRTGARARPRVPSHPIPVVLSSSETLPENSPPVAPNPLFPKSWQQDEQYARFVADYLGTGANLIGEDFAEAWQWSWRPLDFEQKLQRVAALTKHAEEYHADPRFVPKPKKFLETEWKRDPKPPARQQPPIKKKSNLQLMQERMAKSS